MNYAPNSAAARDIANVLHPYTNLRKHEEKGPLIITKGQGVHVWDDQGNRYIEGMAGLWCASLGWNEEELIEAAVKQMRELPYYHGFTHKSSMPSIDLAEKLKSIAPADFSKVFFVNSGSEANDTQVKLVRYYNNAVGRPEKKKIIGRIKGYHGVTVAAASLNIAKGQPRKAADTSMESTPVWGVEIKKPTDAPSDAPSFLRPSPAGITPQEQSGSGTPRMTDLTTLPRPVRCRRTKSLGSSTWMTPLRAAPSSNQGARASMMSHRLMRNWVIINSTPYT